MTEACRGPLAPALVGRRIDAAHPAARAWASARGIDPAELVGDELSPAPAPKDKATAPIALDVDGEVVVGATWAEVVEELTRRWPDRRLVVLPEEETVLDLDHPAVREWLSKEWGRSATPADLGQLWRGEVVRR